ncbi:MAG: hypothetical protein LRY66_01295 [Saccharospirillaceae bacterium]|nr:hypothetical protein [Saccharospirillaceae bacterium]MCD8530003.1 hypothetical protein [Saccharospirillaceae bacterium]
MQLPAAYRQLIECFDALPGIGPRAAARLAQHVLEHDLGARLQQAIQCARDTLQHCSQCRSYSLAPVCTLCADAGRQQSQLLVLAGVDDQAFWEGAGYRGGYFILHGLLSPVAGIGPRQLHLPQLKQRVESLLAGLQSDSKCPGPAARSLSLLIVLEPSVEAEATAQFIDDMLADLACDVQRLTPHQLTTDLQREQCMSVAGCSLGGAEK